MLPVPRRGVTPHRGGPMGKHQGSEVAEGEEGGFRE